MKLKIKVQTKATSNKITGWRNKELIIKTTAAPDKDKANKSIINILSQYYNIPKSVINIESGLTSQHKVVNIDANIKI